MKKWMALVSGFALLALVLMLGYAWMYEHVSFFLTRLSIVVCSAVLMAWSIRLCAQYSRSTLLAVWRLEAMVLTFLTQVVAILGQSWPATERMDAIMTAVLGLAGVSLLVRVVPARWRGQWLGRA